MSKNRLGRVEKRVLLSCYNRDCLCCKRDIIKDCFDLKPSTWAIDSFRSIGVLDRERDYDWECLRKYNSVMVTYGRVRDSLARKGLITIDKIGHRFGEYISLTEEGKAKAKMLNINDNVIINIKKGGNNNAYYENR